MSAPSTPFSPSRPLPGTWPRRWAVAGAGLLALGLVIGLVLTSVGAGQTGEDAVDRDIAADRFGTAIWLAKFINVAIGPPLAATLLAVVCIAIWAEHSLRLAVVFGALTSVGWCSSLIGKVLVARHRPPSSVHPLILETGHDSFPSGHTSFAAAVLAATCATLWLTGRSTRRAWIIGTPLVAVVAASRLVLGAHYVGDVLAAGLFAFGAVGVAAGLWRTGRVPGVSEASGRQWRSAQA